MHHRYSKQFLAEKLPGPSYRMHKFLGYGVGSVGVVIAAFWQMGPQEFKYLFPFLFYLFFASLFALLVVLVRRLFRRPESMRKTIAEVDKHGVWRVAPKSRELVMGVRELRAISVTKSEVNEILSIVLEGATRSLRVEGLENMYAFLEDLHSHFPRTTVTESRLRQDQPQP